jgi:hypothetical protein
MTNDDPVVETEPKPVVRCFVQLVSAATISELVGGARSGSQRMAYARLGRRGVADRYGGTDEERTRLMRAGLTGPGFVRLGASSSYRRFRFFADRSEAVGVPIAGRQFFLATTSDGRIGSWQTEFVRSRPGRFRGTFDPHRIDQITATGRVVRRSVTIVVGETVLTFRAIRRREVDPFVAAVEALRHDPGSGAVS